MILTMYRSDFEHFINSATLDNDADIADYAELLRFDKPFYPDGTNMDAVDGVYGKLIKFINDGNISARLAATKGENTYGVKDCKDLLTCQSIKPSMGNLKVVLDD